jgi:serine/threonine protein kinase
MLSRDLPPHPNVVRFYGISFDGQQTALVLEYCSGGSFYSSFFSHVLDMLK